MKTLIAINGWIKGALNGEHQAMRDTFLRDVEKFPGLSYRFFVGDGTPTGEDEIALQQSWDCAGIYRVAHPIIALEPLASPKSDEVILHVPDDYLHVSYKTRENHRWALQQGFDHVFQCFTDIFIDIHRLMTSGFENYDWSGSFSGGGEKGVYAGGGPGVWTSEKAIQCIINEPVTLWADDWWVGSILNRHAIPLHVDSRYSNYPECPRAGNDIITSHLANTPVVYDPKLMYALWKDRYGS